MIASLTNPRPVIAAFVACVTLSSPLALAQSDRPAAAAPERTTIMPVADDETTPPGDDVRPLSLEVEPAPVPENGPSRRPAREVGDELVSITWNDV